MLRSKLKEELRQGLSSWVRLGGDQNWMKASGDLKLQRLKGGKGKQMSTDKCTLSYSKDKHFQYLGYGKRNNLCKIRIHFGYLQRDLGHLRVCMQVEHVQRHA